MHNIYVYVHQYVIYVTSLYLIDRVFFQSYQTIFTKKKKLIFQFHQADQSLKCFFFYKLFPHNKVRRALRIMRHFRNRK